jgi:hypothetical protein
MHPRACMESSATSRGFNQFVELYPIVNFTIPSTIVSASEKGLRMVERKIPYISKQTRGGDKLINEILTAPHNIQFVWGSDRTLVLIASRIFSRI